MTSGKTAFCIQSRQMLKLETRVLTPTPGPCAPEAEPSSHVEVINLPKTLTFLPRLTTIFAFSRT
jgi:hypothetical protein